MDSNKHPRESSGGDQPPAKHQSRKHNPDQAEDADPVLRTYGVLGEAFQFSPETDSYAYYETLCQRWHKRRLLAEYSRYPEGYEFSYSVEGQPDRAVILLSPPDQVAVRQEDGGWRRIKRDTRKHDPQPYTPQWYEKYLRNNQLPLWFPNTDHVRMTTNDSEAVHLKVPKYARMNTFLSSEAFKSDYLVARYPATPHQPRQLAQMTKSILDKDISPAERDVPRQ